MTFDLSISLGADAMQTPADVAAELRRIAAKLDETHDWPRWSTGLARDVNGNTCGSWTVS